MIYTTRTASFIILSLQIDVYTNHKDTIQIFNYEIVETHQLHLLSMICNISICKLNLLKLENAP